MAAKRGAAADVLDPHEGRIACLSGLLGIFAALCVGLVALLVVPRLVARR